MKSCLREKEMRLEKSRIAPHLNFKNMEIWLQISLEAATL